MFYDYNSFMNEYLILIDCSLRKKKIQIIIDVLFKYLVKFYKYAITVVKY